MKITREKAQRWARQRAARKAAAAIVRQETRHENGKIITLYERADGSIIEAVKDETEAQR